MRKREIAATVLVVTLLPLLLSLASADEKYYTGLGISNPDIVKIIDVGKNYVFEVALLDNTGTLNLSITATWTSNSTGLNITMFAKSEDKTKLLSNPFFLQGKTVENGETVKQGDRIWVYANTSASTNRTHRVTFKFTCTVHTPPDMVGNPSKPSGSATATFTARYPEATPLNLMPIILAVAASGTVTTMFCVALRRNKKREKH